MRPSRIYFLLGVVLIGLGLAFGIYWFDRNQFLASLIFTAVSLLPGMAQLAFYRHYCLHPRQPGDWEIWVPSVVILTVLVLFADFMWLLSKIG